MRYFRPKKQRETIKNNEPTKVQLKYKEFLASLFWANLTEEKKKIIPYCENCRKGVNLHCHHKFYRDNWYETKLEDLKVLCEICHKKEHNLYKEPKKNKGRHHRKLKKKLRRFNNNYYREPKLKFISYEKYAEAKYGPDYKEIIKS